MSFTGNLEDLAIVDVIQLLHSTRKSGTLCVLCNKGQSQIVFNNGYIISANHYNDSIRIGKILVEMGTITPDVLQQALAEQQTAGTQRKPLIGMLIEKNVLDKESAYKGLECLIEMTIVEMVSWQKGTFTLDVDIIDINDEYRYIPETLQQELNFNTQMVLLDALRIYDEKCAAGTNVPEISVQETSNSNSQVKTALPAQENEQGVELSADMLGLDSIEQVEFQLPETFIGLEAFDPAEMHRQKMRYLLTDFSVSQREELITYLTSKTNIAHNLENVSPELKQTIILFGSDELLHHGLMSTCKFDGIMVFTASSAEELEKITRQSLDRSLTPVLVFDTPLTQSGFSAEDVTLIRQQMAGFFPDLHAVQIYSPDRYTYALHALTTGASSVVPRAAVDLQSPTCVSDFIQFLEIFPLFIHRLFKKKRSQELLNIELLNTLRNMRSASDIAFFLLEQTSQIFERCLTLILRNNELIAEKSFGVEADKSKGPSNPLRFKIKVNNGDLLARVINEGECFYSSCDDSTIRKSIFGEICAPDKSKIMLLPLVAAGKTLALIYADFGQSKEKKVELDYLKNLAWLAGITLDKILKIQR